MQLTTTQKFILYALGIWYLEANEKLKDKQLEIAISKAVFIDIVKEAGIVEKQSRALYKNLELLEKSKLIKYNNKNLSLTKKGNKIFSKVREDSQPYIEVAKILAGKNPLSYSKRLQTRFSLE